MKSLLLTFFTISLALCIQSCSRVCGCVSPPMSSELMGQWEWTRTETPSRTVTPQTAGYTQTLEYGNDQTNNYLAIYRNDTLSMRLGLVRGSTQENTREFSVLEKYASLYPKSYLIRNSTHPNREIYTSELMENYSAKADTVRHYYKFKGYVAR